MEYIALTPVLKWWPSWILYSTVYICLIFHTKKIDLRQFYKHHCWLTRLNSLTLKTSKITFTHARNVAKNSFNSWLKKAISCCSGCPFVHEASDLWWFSVRKIESNLMTILWSCNSQVAFLWRNNVFHVYRCLFPFCIENGW